jgi:molybdopterin synthase catalytic subunit
VIRTLITPDAFSPEKEMRAFSGERDGEAGALASFVGYCRTASPNGPVNQLELDHYPGFTEKEVSRLAHSVAARHNLLDLIVIHRIGVIAAHDPIVLVAALSSHRAEAFAAVVEMMDYLKTDAPFWKRETGPEGSRWIEPTTSDYARRAEHSK